MKKENEIFTVSFIIIVISLLIMIQIESSSESSSNNKKEEPTRAPEAYKTPKSKKEKVLEEVNFSGRTANILYEIEKHTIVAQHFHEGMILEKIYYIINGNKADKINITITDYCKDSYGYENKRYWHISLDKSWLYWNEVNKYANAESFSGKLAEYYILSRETQEEEPFLCCGRDRGCN